MFDYVLTGPISVVSAGLYLAGLINETAEHLGHPGVRVNPPQFAAVFTILVTLYFHGDGGDPDRVVPAHRSSPASSHSLRKPASTSS